MAADTTKSLSRIVPSSNVGVVIVMNAGSFSIKTDCTLGTFSQFTGLHAAFLVRSRYINYVSTGLVSSCFDVSAGGITESYSPKSQIGPFNATAASPLFYGIPAAFSVVSLSAISTTYAFNLFIAPRYSLESKVAISIEFDYMECSMQFLTSIQFNTSVPITNVTTSRGLYPFSSCIPTMALDLQSAIGITCIGTFDPVTHGSIVVTVP